MHDKRIIEIDFPEPLYVCLVKNGLAFNTMEVAKMIEEIFALSKKFVFDINTGVTGDDILMLIDYSGIYMQNDRMRYDFILGVTNTIKIFVGLMTIHNLFDSVLYVLESNDYKVVLQTYKL